MSLKRFINLQQDFPFGYTAGDNLINFYPREDLRINDLIFCSQVNLIKSETIFFILEFVNLGKGAERQTLISKLTTKTSDCMSIDIIAYKKYNLPIYYDFIGRNDKLTLRIRPTGYTSPGLTFGNYILALECEGM